MGTLDRGVVLAGVWVTVGLGLPLVIAFAVADPDEGSPWVGLGLVALIAIFFGGGTRVGRLAPDQALAHGAVAGLVAFAVVQMALIPVILLSDRSFDAENVPGLVFNALLLSIVAMLGAMLGARMARRDRGAR